MDPVAGEARAPAVAAALEQAVTIWLAFFPLSLTATLLTSRFLDVPLAARVLLMTLCLTPLMTYLVLPRITRALHWWLHGRPTSWRAAIAPRRLPRQALLPHTRQQLPGQPILRIELPRCRSVLRDGGRHPRRWVAALACLAALVALACEGGNSRHPAPRRARRPSGRPGGIAALGDSISTGFGSCLVLTSCERNSWSTGDGLRVQSHYRRLLDQTPRSATGRTTTPCPAPAPTPSAGQAQAAVRDRADYVTVLIGANDVCRGGMDAMTAGGALPQPGRPGAAGAAGPAAPRPGSWWRASPTFTGSGRSGTRRPRGARSGGGGICPALLAEPHLGRHRPTGPAGPPRRADRRVQRRS